MTIFLGQINIGTAQVDTSIYSIIDLDSIVVKAQRSGFNVEEFIELVKNDTSFYAAFKNLRFLNYRFTNDIKVTYFQSNNLVTYQGVCNQSFRNGCRSMECDQPNINGQYYKKNGPKYFTSKLYEQLFFTPETVCNQKRTSVFESLHNQKHWTKDPAGQIKIILFNPGRASTLPIVGKKMKIFDPKMLQHYNYAILAEDYLGEPCYVFSILVKPTSARKTPKKTVVKKLKTYFSKKDFQVIAREYHLKYAASIVNFDIKMDIKLDQIGGLYYPMNILFNGFWDVPTKKAEQSKFELQLSEVRL